MDDFNPRTPCGVRRSPEFLRRFRCGYFNPRTPCGVRPHGHRRGPLAGPFQSTHPLRGATMTVDGTEAFTRISIHAPLAGCDTCTNAGAARNIPFQSTHPLRGATFLHQQAGVFLRISIHAPLAGCDFTNKINTAAQYDFNPRTPCGVRLPFPEIPSRRLHFNPRTPCGVRHKNGCNMTVHREFQSTHPLRGATCGLSILSSTAPFQSTHPLRGATKTCNTTLI